MSVFRCEICERSVDSDFHECHETAKGLICDDCQAGIEDEEQELPI